MSTHEDFENDPEKDIKTLDELHSKLHEMRDVTTASAITDWQTNDPIFKQASRADLGGTERDPHKASTRCIWCGSDDTYFIHYECWEEDEMGNAIEVDSMDTKYTPRTEAWWCNNCDGGFIFDVEYPSDSVESEPPQPPAPPPPPSAAALPHHPDIDV